MPRKSPYIIVADDDFLILDVVANALRDDGYEVATFQSAAASYAAIVVHLPDLVILDLQMEQADSGMQLIQLMRLNPVTAHIPVILMSANILYLRETRAQLDVKGYKTLEKPFDLDGLLELVQMSLRIG